MLRILRGPRPRPSVSHTSRRSHSTYKSENYVDNFIAAPANAKTPTAVPSPPKASEELSPNSASLNHANEKASTVHQARFPSTPRCSTSYKKITISSYQEIL